MQKPRIAASLCFVLWLTALSWADEPPIQQLEALLKPRFLTAEIGTSEAVTRTLILSRPDPGTYFLRYAYGLKQHARKLLSTEQQFRLVTILDQHAPSQIRWHDERNTLRCKFNEVMWQHAASSEAESLQLRSQLESWMQHRMKWTQQEHLAQYRLAREVWNILTLEQQQKLLFGQWKDYAKQDTGHTRGDATAKRITRALGKPDDQAAFETAVSTWSSRRLPLHSGVTEAENNERRIVFAMYINCEAMVHTETLKATAAYSILYLAEAKAIRTIVMAAYRDPATRCKQAAADAWKEAEVRFTKGASEMIELLSRP